MTGDPENFGDEFDDFEEGAQAGEDDDFGDFDNAFDPADDEDLDEAPATASLAAETPIPSFVSLYFMATGPVRSSC